MKPCHFHLFGRVPVCADPLRDDAILPSGTPLTRLFRDDGEDVLLLLLLFADYRQRFLRIQPRSIRRSQVR